jgi:hypothetical protein
MIYGSAKCLKSPIQSRAMIVRVAGWFVSDLILGNILASLLTYRLTTLIVELTYQYSQFSHELSSEENQTDLTSGTSIIGISRSSRRSLTTCLKID